MAQTKSAQERRRRPRVKLSGGVVAKVQTVLQAPVIDLSVSGALIEVDEALRPGSRCSVRLPVSATDSLRLTARVVRSILVSLARRGSGGTRAARYQAAVEFVDVSEEDNARLSAYVAAFNGGVSAEISADSPPKA